MLHACHSCKGCQSTSQNSAAAHTPEKLPLTLTSRDKGVKGRAESSPLALKKEHLELLRMYLKVIRQVILAQIKFQNVRNHKTRRTGVPSHPFYQILQKAIVMALPQVRCCLEATQMATVYEEIPI